MPGLGASIITRVQYIADLPFVELGDDVIWLRDDGGVWGDDTIIWSEVAGRIIWVRPTVSVDRTDLYETAKQRTVTERLAVRRAVALEMAQKALAAVLRHHQKLHRRIRNLDRTINRLVREQANLRQAYTRQGRQVMRMQANAESAYRCLEKLKYGFPLAEQRRLIEDAKAFLILETIIPGENREAQ